MALDATVEGGTIVALRAGSWSSKPPPARLVLTTEAAPKWSSSKRRALQRDLADLGDSVAVVLLERAERCFLAWEMDRGERLLEEALSRVHEALERPTPPPASGRSRLLRRLGYRGRLIGRAADWFNSLAGVTLEDTKGRTEGGTHGKRDKLRGFDCPRVA